MTTAEDQISAIEKTAVAAIERGASQTSISVRGTAHWKSPNSPRKIKTLDTTMRVTTPENISFQYQVTGPFRRVFAYGLDILISLAAYSAVVALISLICIFVILPIATWLGGAALFELVLGTLYGMISIGYFIIYWFYGAYMETYFNGQTLGKRITNMRVIATDGHAIDGVQATLRNFFRFLDLMPFVPIAAILQLDFQLPNLVPTCLFALIVMMLSRKYQRLGDLVANTVVVNEEKKRQPELATFLDSRVPQLAELIPTTFVVPASMARAVADYVDLRKYLPLERAAEMAGYLARPLIERFGIERDTNHDLFLCALYYKTFVSSKNDEDVGVIPVVSGNLESAPMATFAETVGEFQADGSGPGMGVQ